MANLVTVGTASIFSNQAKFPRIEEVFPLFEKEDDGKEFEEFMLNFANEFNKKFEENKE